MRLGYGGKPRQATLADLACLHAIAGKFDEALAELEDVESWNLSLRYISTRNRGYADGSNMVRSNTTPYTGSTR